MALNPIIKFSTLFGLLAVEIAVKTKQSAAISQKVDYTPIVGIVMLTIALIFICRSFYAMRIPRLRPVDPSIPAHTVPTGSVESA